MREREVDDVDVAGVRRDPVETAEDPRQADAAVLLGDPDDEDGGARGDPERLPPGAAHGPAGHDARHERAVAVAVGVGAAGLDRAAVTDLGGVGRVDEAARRAVQGPGVGHARVHDRDPDAGSRAGLAGAAAEALRGEDPLLLTVVPVVTAGQLHRVVGRHASNPGDRREAPQRRRITPDDLHVQRPQRGDDVHPGDRGHRTVVRDDGLQDRAAGHCGERARPEQRAEDPARGRAPDGGGSAQGMPPDRGVRPSLGTRKIQLQHTDRLSAERSNGDRWAGRSNLPLQRRPPRAEAVQERRGITPP